MLNVTIDDFEGFAKADGPLSSLRHVASYMDAAEQVRFHAWMYHHFREAFWLDEDRNEDRDFQPHAHSFDWALSYLMEYPEHFSIEGFEEFYSEQEIELIQKFQKKLLEDMGKH